VQQSPDQPVAEPRVVARRLAGAASAAPHGTLHAYTEHGPDGWPVLEQDLAITADEPAVNGASMLAARESIEFLNTAHKTEEINR
jgi:hypothetical protein